MKKILVIYSSQTGQMSDVLQSLCADIKEKARIDFFKIELESPFPFPWKDYDTFFDAMPESVLGIPQAIKPLAIPDATGYDLVILGYQPWFLSPSVPFNSFLQSEYAAVLKGKPVVTVIACRNMWLRAQEKVKESLLSLGATLVGNIALDDKHPNLASTMSIVRWMIHGQKEASDKYPEAGVSTGDIKDTRRFGPTILHALEQGQLDTLQVQLLEQDAIPLRPNLIVMEGNGARQFPKWAANTIKQGKAGDPARKKMLKKFKVTLFIAIFILSPVSGGLARLKTLLTKKKTAENLAYFRQVAFVPGKI